MAATDINKALEEHIRTTNRLIFIVFAAFILFVLAGFVFDWWKSDISPQATAKERLARLYMWKKP